MKVVPSFLSAELARTDIGNLSRTMYDLQRQSASGVKATDLKGFGDDNRQILSARGEIQRLEVRKVAAERAETRIGIQEFALTQATEGMKALQESAVRALAINDGRFLHVELDTAFRLVQSALNQRFGGQYLFSGERTDEPSIRPETLEDLTQVLTDADIFTSSPRPAVLDIGDGRPTPVAEQARDFAGEAMVAMRDLKRALDREGGAFSNPLTEDQRAVLGRVNALIGEATGEFIAAQGRNGALQKRVEMDQVRLEARLNFLEAQIGEAADANLAEIAMRIAAVQTQYQAAARVFAQISELSVINFLR